LVVALPGVGWDDVRDRDLPNIRRFLPKAAVGDLATRVGRSNAVPTEAYLTIGAGTRAMAPPSDGDVALDAGDNYGGVPAADVLARRLGEVPDGIGYPAIGPAHHTNDTSVYGATVGLLGDRLERAGVARAVIANADATESFVADHPPAEWAYARSAATALMDSHGIVPGGIVDRSLLDADPTAPFGHRLDPANVLRAFDRQWDAHDRSVVLVEASDLSRAAAYRPRATAAQARQQRARALTDADALLGQLLTRVDPAHDAVLVISPVSAHPSPALGIAALAAPGVEGGLLQSATTRRAGYVQLADITPTVLSLMGAKAPDDIEGRGFQVVGHSTSTDRVTSLADAAAAADFRDNVLLWVVLSMVTGLVVLAAGMLVRPWLGPGMRALLPPLAFSLLGAVPASFIVARFDGLRSSGWVYGAALAAVAVVIGLACMLVERRWPAYGVVAAVGAIVGLVVVDVLVGAPLQVNSVYGYSLAVAGRFAGLGNLAFAVFGSATILLAALLVDRLGRARGGAWALGLLVAVVLIEGLPMLGADVGGVLSMVPAFGITALLLVDRRVSGRALVGLGGVTALAVLLFAFIDETRPSGSQTHLARLTQLLVEGRWGRFSDTLTRRWQASFGSAQLAGWIAVIAVGVLITLYVALVLLKWAGPDAPRRQGPAVAAVAGVVVLAAAGLVANDSSFAVPSTMLFVVVPVVALRILELDAAAGTGADEPHPLPEPPR
jgi:hypothetical protein